MGAPLVDNPAGTANLNVQTPMGEPPQTQSKSVPNPIQTPAHETPDAVSNVSIGPGRLPPTYLSESLVTAETLLGHAAQAGIPLEDGIRTAILKARASYATGMSDQIAADLLAALTKLAARVSPVTTESLRASANSKETKRVMRIYVGLAIVLASLIVPYSLFTFVSSAISDTIKKDLDLANTLAVKLNDELGPSQTNTVPVPSLNSAAPAQQDTRFVAAALPHGVTEKDVIKDLQQFAAAIRAIDGEARKLNAFVLNLVSDPFASHRTNTTEMKRLLELTPGLPYPLASEAAQKIGVYQNVRYFAQSIQEWVSIFYGAIANCILPLLYALLGACAYLLRTLDQAINDRTFTTSKRDFPHLMVAAIAGLVVGLFNNFNTQAASLSPLALAFLVGYAVDVFFSFLETFLQSFRRSKASPPQN
jgi:hypothetical protein